MKNDYLLFEDYLRNEIDIKDAEQLESRLNDSEINKQFTSYKEVRTAMINKLNDKKELELGTTIYQLNKKYFKANQANKLRSLRSPWLMSIAAVGMILLTSILALGLFQTQNYSDAVLAEKYYYNKTTRSANTIDLPATAIAYANANQLFQDKNYIEAEKAFESLVEPTTIYSEYAEWNLLICKLATEQDHTKLLNEILNDKEHIMYAKAQALEKELGSVFRKFRLE